MEEHASEWELISQYALKIKAGYVRAVEDVEPDGDCFYSSLRAGNRRISAKSVSQIRNELYEFCVGKGEKYFDEVVMLFGDKQARYYARDIQGTGWGGTISSIMVLLLYRIRILFVGRIEGGGFEITEDNLMNWKHVVKQRPRLDDSLGVVRCDKKVFMLHHQVGRPLSFNIVRNHFSPLCRSLNQRTFPS